VLESEVSSLRVRNYTPVETSTPPARLEEKEQPTPSPTPLQDFQVTAVQATTLPTNPAELTPANLERSAVQGIGVVFAGFVIAGLYLGLRMLMRR
jgi:hypothetical protein